MPILFTRCVQLPRLNYEHAVSPNFKDGVINSRQSIPLLFRILLCLCFYAYENHALFYVKMGVRVGVPGNSRLIEK